MPRHPVNVVGCLHYFKIFYYKSAKGNIVIAFIFATMLFTRKTNTIKLHRLCQANQCAARYATTIQKR